jgi:hypothetical protein
MEGSLREVGPIAGKGNDDIAVEAELSLPLACVLVQLQVHSLDTCE